MPLQISLILYQDKLVAILINIGLSLLENSKIF